MYPSPRPLSEFQTFFRDWLTRLELYHQQLLGLLQSLDEQDESKHKELVRLVTSHYHEYFLAKPRLCSQNVFLVLSSPWFSSHERSFLWLGGFKPGLAIRVGKRCGVELSSDQEEKMERLTRETQDKEKEIADRHARFEREVLPPHLLTLAMAGGREVVNGMVREVDAAVESWAENMELLVGSADYLREQTVAKLVGILTTAQKVRFLAGMVHLQLTIRWWGQRREAEIRGNVDPP